MSKITTNNSTKKLRLLKYSLLASISAAAIIAIPFEGVASSKDTYQDIMEYKKALNRARKCRPSTKKGRESLKSNDSSQDIEDLYKNSSPVQHLEKERYTPTPRKKTSLDNFNSSGDKTFVTANNTLPSTLSTSFDQMEYKYMALRKDVQMKMDKIDSAIEQSQENNKKSLKQAKRSLSKKQKAILNAANIEEQIIELKKADSSSREENKIKELVKELKKSKKKVEKAYSDIETLFHKLKLEKEIISSGFDTSTVQQEPNSQSDFKPAQASTSKKRGVFSHVFSEDKKLFQDADTSAEEPTKLTKSQEQLHRTKAAKHGVADKNKATADKLKRKSLEYKAQIEQDENERIEKIRVDKEAQKTAQEVRKKQAAEAYAAAKKKNNIEEAWIQKSLLMDTLETEIEKKRVLLNNQESEPQVQDNLNQLERIKKILNQKPESLETTREGIGRIGSYEDKTVAENKLLKIEKKQEKQEDLKLKIIGELAKEKPNHSDIKKYYEKVERISGEIKTEIGQITFPPQPPARDKNNTNNVSIPVIPRVQRIVDNSKYSGGYLKPNPPSVQDHIEVFPDPVVNVQPQKEDQPKQHPTFTQAENIRMLSLIKRYTEVGEQIKNLQKTPSSSQQKLIDTSLASIKKEHKNLDNIIQELNKLSLKLVNKPQNEISYNRQFKEKLAEATQIESRINGYQDKIKTNVGFIVANKEDTHIVPKNNLALLGHQNIEYSLRRINSAKSNGIQSPASSNLEYLALEEKFTSLRKYDELDEELQKVSTKKSNVETQHHELRRKRLDPENSQLLQDLAQEALNLSKQESQLQQDIEDLGSTPSFSNSSDSEVEIKAQGYSATPLKKYASVHSISHLVGSKEDLSVEFEKLVKAESLNNESKTDRENIDPKFKTEFKEIMDGFDRVDINSELETLTAAKGLNDQPNANIGTKTEDASDQLLLSTNEHSSLGISNGREDKPSSSGLSDGGKSEHRLLGVSDGSDDEHGLLALSDGRESENDFLKLKDGDDKLSFLRLKSGEKDEDSFLKLIDSDDDYDSGIEEDLEYSKPLKKIDTITTIPLPQAVEEVKKSVAAIAPTTNQQIQTVQKVTKDSIFTRLDSIAVVKINEDNNAAIAAGDEESPVKRGLWMHTMYGVNNQGRVNNINGYRGINKGGTVGFDVEIDNNIIGIAYSNVHSVFKFKNNNNNDKEIIKSHIVSIYVQKELPKNFVLQGLVAASKNFIKNKTTYLFNNTKFKSNVKHRNHSYNAEALLNYNYLAKNNIVITPNIGLRYRKSRDGVYNETGISIQEIALATKENNILSGIIGAKTKIPLKNNNLGLTLHSSIEHNFNEKTQRVNRTIQIQGNKFTQNHIIPKQAKTAYNLGGGIIGSVKNTIISLDYNYYLNKRYHSHQGSIKLKVNL